MAAPQDSPLAVQFPVVLGGAALPGSSVADLLAEVYEGQVRCARDDVECLRPMDSITTTKRSDGTVLDETGDITDFVGLGYRSARCSSGHGACPNLEAGYFTA